MNRLVAALTIIGALLLGMVAYTEVASATKPDPEHKITLCHATDSRTNPYVVVNVDVASVKFQGHNGHDGPVFNAALPKHTKWGDIIPAFSIIGGFPFDYPGKNLADGASILANGCGVPLPTTTTSEATTTSTEGTTTTTEGTTTTSEGTTTSTEGTTTTTEGTTTTTEGTTTTTEGTTTTSEGTTQTTSNDCPDCTTTTTEGSTTSTEGSTTTLPSSSSTQPPGTSGTQPPLTPNPVPTQLPSHTTTASPRFTG